MVVRWNLQGILTNHEASHSTSRAGHARSDLLQTTTMSTLKAVILIVSTTASKDPSADSSGGILKDVFEQDGGGKWEVVDTKIVGDEVLDIQRSIMNWTDRDDGVNLIVSTGGTGFAIHDSTPEVGSFLLRR